MENINVVLEENEDYRLHFAAFDEKDGLLGFMQVLPSEDAYLIEIIYVYEEFRRQGVATAMLDYFFDNLPLTLIKPVQLVFNGDSEDSSLYDFLSQREDFRIFKSGTRYYSTLNSVYNNASIQKTIDKLAGGNTNLHSLAELPTNYLTNVLSELDNAGLHMANSVSEFKDNFDMELSKIFIIDNQLDSIILVSQGDENCIEVNALYQKPGSISLLLTISSATVEAFKLYPDSELVFLTINDKAEAFVKKLLGTDAQIENSYIADWHVFHDEIYF